MKTKRVKAIKAYAVVKLGEVAYGSNGYWIYKTKKRAKQYQIVGEIIIPVLISPITIKKKI